MRNHLHRPTGKLFIRLIILLSVLSMISLHLSCQPFIRVEEHEVLTKELVDKYKINNADLTQLQFFLSSRLVLEATDVERHKEVPEGQHYLNTYEYKTKNVLIFEKDLPGKCIELIPEHKINPKLPSIRYSFVQINWEPMRLHINFDYDYLNYLTFIADDKSGNFVLEYDKKKNSVIYGGKRYSCQDGCGDHMLLFDVEHIALSDSSNDVLPGNPFGPHESDCFLCWLLVIGLGLYFITTRQ